MRRALACLLPVLLLAACGAKDDETAVRDATGSFYDALAEKDGGKLCDLLSESQRKAVAKGGGTSSGSCEQVMRLALNFAGSKDLEQAGQAKITKVEVDGDRATASVDLKGKSGTLGLVRENGDWRVSSFSRPSGG